MKDPTSATISVICSRRKSKGRRSTLPVFCIADDSISNPYRHSRTWYRSSWTALRIASSIYSVAIITCLLAAIFFYFQVESWEKSSFPVLRPLRSTFRKINKPPLSASNIVFEHSAPTKRVDTFALPEGELTDSEDYGGLSLSMLQDDTETRQIYRDPQLEHIDYRLPDAERDDDLEL